MTPVAPAAPAPPVSVHAPQPIPPPAPSSGEQFVPVTPTVPATPGGRGEPRRAHSPRAIDGWSAQTAAVSGPAAAEAVREAT
ncbi:hypothetical protein BZL30_5889 [Mycobacterium kansasii]|uniref:Uncharacterized protein n=1 Tax=Mycobacterium kansasii TaxID=1768 RepID=A0A1V3WZU9_MYCKA|nr:hypothetical protein BZL30_5889 [Mycobacterium kansasii]